ncbi:hypothetical protein BZA77DRAFT_289879 [Pyronema omphalodes]|nr:hypothetical protein BZA77DRAFT_289879 [Pyronema omphalodes]
METTPIATMKEKIKKLFQSLNCLRGRRNKSKSDKNNKGKAKSKQPIPARAETFNVISVTLRQSQTAAPAEAARKSVFGGKKGDEKMDSKAADVAGADSGEGHGNAEAVASEAVIETAEAMGKLDNAAVSDAAVEPADVVAAAADGAPAVTVIAAADTAAISAASEIETKQHTPTATVRAVSEEMSIIVSSSDDDRKDTELAGAAPAATSTAASPAT